MVLLQAPLQALSPGFSVSLSHSLRKSDNYVFIVDLIFYRQVLVICATAFPKRFHHTRETTKLHNMALPAHSNPTISQH
jgi:hypothetical protein